MRYTEYHAGKAVIKDRSLLAEAMEKLAKLEDKEESGGWIPCSERMPAKQTDVLVTVKYSGFMGMHGTWIKIGHLETLWLGWRLHWWNSYCLDATTRAVQRRMIMLKPKVRASEFKKFGFKRCKGIPKELECYYLCIARGCKMLFVSDSYFGVNDWDKNDPRIHKDANCRYKDNRTVLDIIYELIKADMLESRLS